MKRRIVFIALLGMAATAQAEELKNWFGDPFFQVRTGIPDCPTPLGPLLPQSKRNDEAHYRIERGTSCWLAGKCDRANAYWYDAGIGKAVEKTFAGSQDFRDASLWVTVQRRFIMVEGCVASPRTERKLRDLLETLPDVERVIVDVRKPGDVKPPYAILPESQSLVK